MDSATLSVIVPVFNERFLVAEALARLIDVDVPGVSRLEIIVIDDGSTDGTSEILDQLVVENPGSFHLLRQPRNQGKGAALRRGITEATGDLIVFHDADRIRSARPRLCREIMAGVSFASPLMSNR